MVRGGGQGRRRLLTGHAAIISQNVAQAAVREITLSQPALGALLDALRAAAER